MLRPWGEGGGKNITLLYRVRQTGFFSKVKKCRNINKKTVNNLLIALFTNKMLWKVGMTFMKSVSIFMSKFCHNRHLLG